MDETSANPVAGSEPDPVSMIESILEREEAPPTRAEDPKPKPETEQEDPAPEQEDEAPTGEEGDEENEPQEAEQEEPAPEPPKFTVKVDGKEIEVDQDELVRGYQRLSDYTRKTQSLSETRRQVEAEAQRIAAERAHYATNLEQLSTILQTTLPPRPPLEMSETDPIGYTQQNARWEASVQQLQHVMAEQQRVQQQMQQQTEAQRQQMMARAAEQLVEYVPEWKDSKKAAAEKRAVAEHLRTRGYSDAEIAQAADPRAIAMALDAMRYRELMASKPSVDQRIKSAPKVVKPGSGIAAPDRRKALTTQLKRSGGKDINAAAALIDLLG